jgi:hypothetical protein
MVPRRPAEWLAARGDTVFGVQVIVIWLRVRSVPRL